MNTTKKTNHLKWILPILILVVAASGAVVLTKTRKTPEKKLQINEGLLVETIQLKPTTEHVIIFATGTAGPLQEISVVPEVNGKITWLAPAFVEGGFFHKGEKLLEIDPRDYQLAIQKAEAELARTRTGLQTEQEQADIAKREWAGLELSDKGEPGALVLRQPQLDSAKADLEAAQAALESAKLNLSRTHIYAPFNGRVRSKSIGLGEYVKNGAPLAMFASTDQSEIIAPVPFADLRWLNIPSAGSKKQGSSCRISTQADGTVYNWYGTVNRTFGEIDKANRMAKIAIRVDDPYQLKQQQAGLMPLANGLFVDIEIQGTKFDQIIEIPRSALRDGDVVWLADKNDQLEIRPVHILRRQRQSLLIDQGLVGGEELILTNISGAATGLKLRPQQQESQQ